MESHNEYPFVTQNQLKKLQISDKYTIEKTLDRISSIKYWMYQNTTIERNCLQVFSVNFINVF